MLGAAYYYKNKYKTITQGKTAFRVYYGLLCIFIISMPAGYFIGSRIRDMSIAVLFIVVGMVIIVIAFANFVYLIRLEKKIIGDKEKEKKDFNNPTWLKHQYYDLGRSIQDIANDQHVSMMTIKKWVDKLEDVLKI